MKHGSLNKNSSRSIIVVSLEYEKNFFFVDFPGCETKKLNKKEAGLLNSTNRNVEKIIHDWRRQKKTIWPIS